MNADDELLIDRYLGETASDDEVRELDRRLRAEPALRQDLLNAGALETGLRRLTAGAGAEADLLKLTTVAPAGTSSRAWRRMALAAAMLLMLAGWGGAAYFRGRYAAELAARLALERDLAAAREARAETTPRPTPAGPMPEGRIVDMRGLVLALPNGPGEPISMSAGSELLAGRSLWTCPWGAAGIRLTDHVSIQMERSTIVDVTDSSTNGQGAQRELNLKEGMLFVTKDDANAGRPVVVATPHARVTLRVGQVAVVVEKGRTIVETAVDKSEVSVPGRAEPLVVPLEHYLIVEPGVEPKVTRGQLTWQLAPKK